jgi:DNA-binding XRE family transcriptional regulator
MNSPNKVAALLKSWRERYGLNQVEAAARLEVSLKTLQDLEDERRTENVDEVRRVLEIVRTRLNVEEINRTIAEFSGWSNFIPSPNGVYGMHPASKAFKQIPDYTSDADAYENAFAKIGDREAYMVHFRALVPPPHTPEEVPLSTRAEALALAADASKRAPKS